MSTEEDLQRKLERLEQACEQARRNEEQARRNEEQARRNEEQARRENEQLQNFRRDTTLEEYLTACQEHILSKVHLVTDGYLTTRAPSTSPTRKNCPLLLKPWADFLSIQADMIERIDRIIPRHEQLFESVDFLERMGKRISELRVKDEASLVTVQHNTMEVPIRIILSRLYDFRHQDNSLTIPKGVDFQTTVSNLRGPTDTRDTVKRDAKLRTDQICVFRNSTQRDIAYIIEYKAPHKLHTQHLEQGLRRMNIVDEVVNKETIPTAKAEKFKHYAERLTAAAITQTYHYMLGAGLEYGYLTNGDAIVFLKIDWTDPTVLHYHLARPLREVIENEDATYSNSICQVLAFTMLALQSGQHGVDKRSDAAKRCGKWIVDFGLTLDEAAEEEEAAADATTSRSRKHRRSLGSSDWLPTPVKKFRRKPRRESPPSHSDRVLRSSSRRDGPGGGAGFGGSGDVGGGGGGGGAGRPGAASQEGSTADQGSSRPKSAGGGDEQERRREYCTASCLLSLVGGQPLDTECPNVALHRDGAQGEDGHAISYSQFMDLLRQQLSRSLEKGVAVLGIEGACGALFQMTLLQFGYTFVAKGFTGERLRELEHETAIYRKLQPLQGRGIPAWLGSVDLQPLDQVYFYDFDVELVHFLLLSYGGTEITTGREESRRRIIDTVTNILGEMHSLGVVHGDVRRPNVLQGPDGQINVVDFDRAKFLPAKRRDTTLSAISPNKRRRLAGSDGEAEASPPAKKKPLLGLAIQHAIQQDNSNAQSLFTLDCGRIIMGELDSDSM
ncbi:hypothetical protein GMORB2_5707 [Geosmithia morbida]|uniref:Protein kinase domain-containing protein n=1 Tax=Geosmithia morbida TaxID=1094350 RepID=A0A9P5D4X6_9HYPO|nr:uncharacterized protein GMORB2_5707 [Geosmithia morbida]KAF4123991.1 hypothetical protein GMORB2_5707 [Geosmithia morbida]